MENGLRTTVMTSAMVVRCPVGSIRIEDALVALVVEPQATYDRDDGRVKVGPHPRQGILQNRKSVSEAVYLYDHGRGRRGMLGGRITS